MKLTVNNKDYEIKRAANSIFVDVESNASETVDVTLANNVDSLSALRDEIAGFDGSFLIIKNNGTVKNYSGYELTNVRSQLDANNDDTTIQFTAK